MSTMPSMMAHCKALCDVGDMMGLPGAVGGKDGEPPVGRGGWNCGVRLG